MADRRPLQRHGRHARAKSAGVDGARKRAPRDKDSAVELDAVLVEQDSAGRIPCDSAGGVQAESGVCSSHRFIHGASAMKEVPVRGKEVHRQQHRHQDRQHAVQSRTCQAIERSLQSSLP